MDFYQRRTKETKSGDFELYPGFVVGRSSDLMVRGGNFYAIWDEEKGLWSTDEYDVARLVDADLYSYAEEQMKQSGRRYLVKEMRSFESNTWSHFQKFINQVSDNSRPLDQTLTFANTEVKKTDYVSKRLPYALAEGDYSAWDELLGTLYSVEEREKIEWAIGAIISGDSKRIQKFLVFYGPAGTGKSTILNIVQMLFNGYTTTFEAKALGGNNNQFATETFKNNPLVAIQHDGDLSRIEDNTKLNSIISHEEMTMNEKFKSSYTARVNAFLLMGTNQPVKISDAKSGIIRRLIDVHPTGVKIPINRYTTLMSQIEFELGAIAQHCLNVYLKLGKNHYNAYRPLEMMLQTDVFFNFIESYYDIFKEQDGVSLTQAYTLYKEYCSDSAIDRLLPKYKFREELRNYFDHFKDRVEINGQILRSYYQGFNASKFKAPSKDAPTFSLVLDETTSLLDFDLANMPAQGATSRETPKKKWEDVTTVLGEIDTKETHFVKIPDDHIVIDFDLRNEDGEKSLERNLEAASTWPPTYAELSKSGSGVHLHYIYEGDKSQLSSIFSDGIEIKTLLGNASLRRKLTKCNHIPIAKISSGLPLKEKKVIDSQTMHSEKAVRDLIMRNLKKEINPGTKPSIDFIKKILDDAYQSGMTYNVLDLRPRILTFAQGSSHQPLLCIKTVQQMQFTSKDFTEELPESVPQLESVIDERLVFFDIEVYPNLFVVVWKYEGDANMVKMVNPSSTEIEPLLHMKLVGFNNRRYDNHILYAAYMGYNNEQLYKLSQKIIEKAPSAMFGAAFGLSYADIYDFSILKQTLKKFQIELGLPHVELNIPWDQPVDPKLWDKVVEYCCNDVYTTEKTFESRRQDFVARQILADLSGLSVNDTTQKHTAKIIFGDDRNPQSKFIYTDLSSKFPGYSFNFGKSVYRDEDPSEGGYVYAEPGIYENVAVLDVASMHPTSIEQLNLFGPYTKQFSELKSARLAIKHKDYDTARTMLNGALSKHLQNMDDAKALSDALKIVINTVYGLTSAKFDNPFRDIRNKDNIVAKRGALFMIDLKHAVQEQGFTVAHIKTDSIKIPNATPEIIQFVSDFGKEYGYDFEHETTYEKFCLVNDAVYIARKPSGQWDAVGAQFQHPYVYKTLFSHEPIEFADLCETKQVVKGAIYIDFNYDNAQKTDPENMVFVGRTGSFTPVHQDQGGGILYRVQDEKNYAVAGTKGFYWLEADVAKTNDSKINYEYFEKLVQEAIKTINKFGDFDLFVKD